MYIKSRHCTAAKVASTLNCILIISSIYALVAARYCDAVNLS